jgi:predicted helicase
MLTKDSKMLNAYLDSLRLTQTRNPSEHAYRSSLRHILGDLSLIDEPSNKGKNKIDMEVYTKSGLVSFYIETKMLGYDLSAKQYKKQFDRYRKDFQKLLITNFVDFEFYRDGQLIGKCSLASKDSLLPNQNDFDTFQNLLDNFLVDCVSFKNPILLAKKLADKTRVLKKQILDNLNRDETEIKTLRQSNQPITKKYKIVAYRDEFKRMLLEDVDNNSFADLYAQTITYGLFASRYYAYQQDPNIKFTKAHASDFIPITNPLLKQLFEAITLDSKSNDFDKAINLVIDDVTTILAHTNMELIISELKEENNDIVIHFYETFLEHYDKDLRKKMGVWYTPTDLVDYIVKGVDFILKQRFSITEGISSDEKQDYTYSKNVVKPDGSIKTENITRKNIHRVQVLDPAVGTGNFLNATINYIKRHFKMPSFWKDYVNQDLIPRLNGFELMMPSYVMAHMKMYELLKNDLDQTSKRFNIYLTNTLYGNIEVEQSILSASDLIYQLNEEVSGANRVRNEQPIMVVMGNPPYNGNSQNNGDFISNLMQDYRGEMNVGKGLNDDYIKFIRYGQSLVDQNQTGILAYVSNSSFIQSIACSEMRKSLLGSFDEIYILNLHGDVDENVFNIKTPVCVSFFVKTNKKKSNEMGKVYYHEVMGSKDVKLIYFQKEFSLHDFQELDIVGNESYFIPQDLNLADEYNKDAFSLNDLFSLKGQAILTACDELVVDVSRQVLEEKIKDYKETGWLPKSVENSKETKDSAKYHLKNLTNKDGTFKNFSYRPFDNRHIYDSNLICRRKKELTKHEKVEGNFYLNFKHNCWDKNPFTHISVTKGTPCNEYFAHGATHTAPIYLLDEKPLTPNEPQFFSNLNPNIKDFFIKLDSNICDFDIVDYVYGLLNDKAYTTKYDQFLKSNYPLIQYPDSMSVFNHYKAKGNALRLLHLDDVTQDSLSSYKTITNNAIEKIVYDEVNQRVYFNDEGYFDHITKEMWLFKVGASTPLSDWLSSRCKLKCVFDRQMVGAYLNVIHKVRNSI